MSIKKAMLLKKISLVIVFICLVSCSHQNVLLRDDPKLIEIENIKTKLTKTEAIETIKSSITKYYKPKQISVQEDGYEFRVVTNMAISGGVQRDGSVPIIKMPSSDIVFRLKFNNVIGISTNRWGAVDDAIAFWDPKRYIIVMTLSDPEETDGNNKSASLLCYDYDRDRIIASLLLLCPNLKKM